MHAHTGTDLQVQRMNHFAQAHFQFIISTRAIYIESIACFKYQSHRNIWKTPPEYGGLFEDDEHRQTARIKMPHEIQAAFNASQRKKNIHK